MPTKKTVTKKKEVTPPLPRTLQPKALDPISEDSYEQLTILVGRMHKAPDFIAFVRLIEDFREDYNQAGYDPAVISDSNLQSFYAGGRFFGDNILDIINGIVHPAKSK